MPDIPTGLPPSRKGWGFCGRRVPVEILARSGAWRGLFACCHLLVHLELAFFLCTLPKNIAKLTAKVTNVRCSRGACMHLFVYFTSFYLGIQSGQSVPIIKW